MTASIGLDFAQRSSLRSSDITRADAITLNVVFSVFRTDVTGQHLQTTFSGSVCRNGFTTQLRHHRADIDDFTMSFFHHRRQNCFRNNERSIQVNINNTTEISSFHFVHRNATDNTGIVYKNINGTYFFCDSGNHSLYGRFIRYITYISVCLDSFFSVRSQTFIHQFLIDVVETDSCALFRKSRCNSKTDTIRSACYKGYFTFQRKIQILIHDTYIIKLMKLYDLFQVCNQ